MSELLLSEANFLESQNSDQRPKSTSVELRLVSVVVPLYNEEACLPHLLEQLKQLSLRNSESVDFEYVFVDDGSVDDTREYLEAALPQHPSSRVVVHDQNRGIAAAIQSGIKAASHETVVSIDADGSYDLCFLDAMIPMLEDGVDMVTASPYHPAGSVENVPEWRLWISRRASTIYRATMLQKLHCCTSCFRVYRRSKVANLELDNEGFVGVAELAWRLDRQGSKIVEHPAVLRSRVAGKSKMKVLRATFKHLGFLSRIALGQVKVRPHSEVIAAEQLPPAIVQES